MWLVAVLQHFQLVWHLHHYPLERWDQLKNTSMIPYFGSVKPIHKKKLMFFFLWLYLPRNNSVPNPITSTSVTVAIDLGRRLDQWLEMKVLHYQLLKKQLLQLDLFVILVYELIAMELLDYQRQGTNSIRNKNTRELEYRRFPVLLAHVSFSII